MRSADLRNNDIRTKDIRNNEIRGLDIRNSTIQGRDVALATITGEDVKESTLSQVPSAARADTANTAAAVDSLRVIGAKTVAQGGAPVTLVQYGPLTVTGACVADMTGPRAEVRVQSTEAGVERGRRGGVVREPRGRRSGRGRGDLHGPARDRVLADRRVRRRAPRRSAAWCR